MYWQLGKLETSGGGGCAERGKCHSGYRVFVNTNQRYGRKPNEKKEKKLTPRGDHEPRDILGTQFASRKNR